MVLTIYPIMASHSQLVSVTSQAGLKAPSGAEQAAAQAAARGVAGPTTVGPNTTISNGPPTNTSAQPTTAPQTQTGAQPLPLGNPLPPSTKPASAASDVAAGQGSQPSGVGGGPGVGIATGKAEIKVGGGGEKNREATVDPVLADVLSRVLHCCYSEAWQTRLSGATALKMLIPKCGTSPFLCSRNSVYSRINTLELSELSRVPVCARVSVVTLTSVDPSFKDALL